MAKDPSYVSIYYRDAELQKRLSDLLSRLRNPAPQLKAAREILLFYIDQGFEQERSPDGTPWKPNTSFTKAQKRAQGRINKVLQSTGRGRASITGQVQGNRLIIGTNVGYMAKHQRGDGVAKREFLGISKEARREILAEFSASKSGDRR